MSFESSPATSNTQSPPPAGWDNDADVERARAYLKTAKPSIAGDHGNENAYKIACALNDMGISPEMSVELMFEDWNDKCDPP